MWNTRVYQTEMLEKCTPKQIHFYFKRICVENPFDMIDVKRTNVLLTFVWMWTKAKWFGTGSVYSLFCLWLNKYKNNHIGDLCDKLP